MKHLLTSFFILSSAIWADYPQSTMLKKGDLIFDKNFDSQQEIDKSIILRKHTKVTVKNGLLQAIPPSVHQEVEKSVDKFTRDPYARVRFPMDNKDFIISFRIKYSKPPEPVAKPLAWIEIGHRWIRLEINPNETTLVFENHILGKFGKQLLQQSSDLTLKWDQWFEGTVEISGDEALFNINGELLHVKHELVKKMRKGMFGHFCLDHKGTEYHLDRVTAWHPAGYQNNWKAKRSSIEK